MFNGFFYFFTYKISAPIVTKVRHVIKILYERNKKKKYVNDNLWVGSATVEALLYCRYVHV